MRQQLDEHKDKLSEADRKGIEEARTALEEAARGDDKARIQAALADFQKKAQRLGEIMYAQGAGASGEAGGGAAGTEPPHDNASERSGGNDEPVDADFEVKA